METSEWTVTLDITVEATSREDAFAKVEALLRDAKAYCLYDAEQEATFDNEGDSEKKYRFEGLSNHDLMILLQKVEERKSLSPSDEDFCRAIRQELKRRWTTAVRWR